MEDGKPIDLNDLINILDNRFENQQDYIAEELRACRKAVRKLKSKSGDSKELNESEEEKCDGDAE